MKKLISSIYIIGFVLLSTSCLETNSATEVKLVSAEEMKAILELEDARLIDVRTPKEFNELRIANAQNIDFSSPTFDEDVSKLDKTKPVVLYCKGGHRSAKCAKKLIEAGFEKVYDLEGGISKWKHSDKIKIEEKS